jgi:hypothetical protein
MEEYRDVKGYEGIYQVSNLGNVRRIYRKKKGFGYLKPIKHSGGYSRLKLRNKGKDKDVYIHRLVADAFLDGSGEVVNHKDGIRTNNNLFNLEWCSQRENLTHSNNKRILHSRFAGVSTIDNKWRASIFINGKMKVETQFNCETSAYVSYLKMMKENNIVNKYA